jgi:HD superfamily phosphodiesterase
MSYVLIHNPGCGSSKKGLEVLEAAGVQPEIRRYMLVAERLSVDELKEIARKIEEELTYPGQILVSVIRETRAESTARGKMSLRTPS